MSVPVTRLNHAVLYVRELDRAVDFYRTVFGFDEVTRAGNAMAFLRASGGNNHHDLGLMAVGASAPRPPRGATGLYHLAWEVPEIENLAEAARLLMQAGALAGASDHGASKSLYGVDPDGNEFEVMWAVPREHWGDFERNGITRALDLEREVARWSRRTTA